MKKKFLWFSDIHLERASSYDKIKFLYSLIKEKPAGIFLTGDISNGIKLCYHLRIIAIIANCPIYFSLGNHDYYFSSLEKTTNKLRRLCQKHKNLIWLNDIKFARLSKKTAVIGVDGWYDVDKGNPNLLKYTTDWLFVKDFRKLPSIVERMDLWKKIAYDSALNAEIKINEVINAGFKNIYLLTHFPPWQEATKDVGSIFENFWISYNTNLTLGRKIKEVMSKHNNIRLTVLSGHTHEQSIVWIRKNIQCIVNDSNYLGGPQIRNIIYI